MTGFRCRCPSPYREVVSPLVELVEKRARDDREPVTVVLPALVTRRLAGAVAQPARVRPHARPDGQAERGDRVRVHPPGRLAYKGVRQPDDLRLRPCSPTTTCTCARTRTTRRRSATSPRRTSIATWPRPRRPGSRSSASPSTSTASPQALELWRHPFWEEQARDDLDAYCEFVARDAAAARDRGATSSPAPRTGPPALLDGARLRLRRRLGPLRRRRRRRPRRLGRLGDAAATPTRSGAATSRRSPRRPLGPLRHPRPPRPGQGLGHGPAAARARPALLLRARGRGDRRERDRGRGLDRRPAQAGRRALPGAARFAEMCVEAGASFALSSDAHLPEQVGFGYDRAVEFLRDLGVERDRRLRAPRAPAGAARAGSASARWSGSATTATASPRAAGWSSAGSRSSTSAASPATPTPTSSPTR